MFINRDMMEEFSFPFSQDLDQTECSWILDITFFIWVEDVGYLPTQSHFLYVPVYLASFMHRMKACLSTQMHIRNVIQYKTENEITCSWLSSLKGRQLGRTLKMGLGSLHSERNLRRGLAKDPPSFATSLFIFSPLFFQSIHLHISAS